MIRQLASPDLLTLQTPEEAPIGLFLREAAEVVEFAEADVLAGPAATTMPGLAARLGLLLLRLSCGAGCLPPGCVRAQPGCWARPARVHLGDAGSAHRRALSRRGRTLSGPGEPGGADSGVGACALALEVRRLVRA